MVSYVSQDQTLLYSWGRCVDTLRDAHPLIHPPPTRSSTEGCQGLLYPCRTSDYPKARPIPRTQALIKTRRNVPETPPLRPSPFLREDLCGGPDLTCCGVDDTRKWHLPKGAESRERTLANTQDRRSGDRTDNRTPKWGSLSSARRLL